MSHLVHPVGRFIINSLRCVVDVFAEAHDYTGNLDQAARNRVLLLNRVVVGNALKKTLSDQTLTGVPNHYHSVRGYYRMLPYHSLTSVIASR
jgi:hypothetical protein